jgi:uncharacterized Zn ribbon protein
MLPRDAHRRVQFLRPACRIPLGMRGRGVGPGDYVTAVFDLKIKGARLTVR